MKILVVEDQTMFREMLASACAQAVTTGQVEQAPDGAAAIARCREITPDLVLLDLELPDADGLDVLEPLRAAVPGLKVIVLSSHTDEFTLHRAMQSHVNGFVDKDSQPVVILREAIHAVMDGKQYFSPVVQRVRLAMRNDSQAFTKILTDREIEMLGLIGAGETDAQIAERYDLRSITVKNHRRNIMSKLGMHSTPDLMRYALEKGFVRMRRAAVRR